MLLKEYIWSVANKLVKENGFTMIHIENQTEFHQELPSLHFIKNIRTTYLYIRLIPVDFIWPNHLLQEMEAAKNRVKEMIIRTYGRKIKFLTLYVFQSLSSEEIQQLIKKESRSSEQEIEIFLGYVELEQKQIGIPEDAFQEFSITKEPFVYYFDHPVNQNPDQLFAEIRRVENEREEKIKKIFHYGKSIFTPLLIGINALLFLIMTFYGGSTNPEVLLQFGAKESFLISQGEYWRLISPIFLHIGFLHFALNNVALYYLGQLTEKIYGSYRFLIIYLFAGIIGNISSFLFVPSGLGAGASGSIFGLFGALLYFGYVYPDLFFRTMGKDILTIIGVNLVFGFLMPNVDNYAHLGGLLGGFLFSSVLHLPRQKNKKWLVTLASLLLIVIITAAGIWGITGREVKGNQAIIFKGEEALEEGNIGKAYQIFAHLVQYYPDNSYNHFYYGETLYQLGDHEQAKAHYKRTLELEPRFPQAYYKLALISIFEKKEQDAYIYLNKALELDPDYVKARNLLNELFSKQE